MRWMILFVLLLAVPAKAQLPYDFTENPPCREKVAYTEMEMPTCEMTLLVNGPVIIRTEQELRERISRYSPVCDTALMPKIDFTKHTLVGRWITLGNCPAGQRFAVRVCFDDTALVYRHIVYAEKNPCRGLSSHMSWILIPRLQEGYRLVFEGRD